ncbi:MAG: YncE family protein [Solirubrobacteraceae bacterium]
MLLASLVALAPAAGSAGANTIKRGAVSGRARYVQDTRLRAGWNASSRPEQRSFSGFSGPLGFGFGSSLVGSAPVGNGPSTLAVDANTHTIYVANGFNTNGPNANGNTVSVIDARDCQARDVSRCKGPWPTIKVGNEPSTIAIDQKTDTVYVTNNTDNTVSVFNGANCNALDSAGCGQTPATVPVGVGPLGIFADPVNHTVYIANFDNTRGDTISMLNSASCNATDLNACPTRALPTVNVGSAPDDVDVNQTSHTVYVGAVIGVAVFDANTCNATVFTGCGAIGTLTGDPNGVNSAKVDPTTNTLYTANYDNTISAFDLRHCNASDLAGCATQTPGTVTPFPNIGFEHDLWVAVDARLHSVYVVYQKDDTLIVVDTNVCNGSHLAGCATLSPPTIHTGSDSESVVLDQQTQTLYTANQVDNNVSVIEASRCNAQTTTGCRHPAPAFTSQPGTLAADAAAHTLYDTSGANSVAMINTDNCNSDSLAGCDRTPAVVNVGDGPAAVAINHRTHTVYIANSGSGTTGTVSVIDSRTCNASDQAGCASLQTLHVPGGNPDDIAVNAATNTIYVATITSSGPDLVSVFNGASCNAANAGGCGQTPATIAVGNSGAAPHNSLVNLAVNRTTNTIYASNLFNTAPGNPPPYFGNSVYVINGATCDATNTTGCGQTPATVTIAPNPPIGSNASGIAVDQATNTIYTANLADGEYPGTVSVINGATCNGQNTSGCGQTPATAAAGFGAVGVAIDHGTHKIYITNTEDTSVSVINGATCNGSDATGCSQTPKKVAVGNYPGSIAVDPAAESAYVTNGDNTVSVIQLIHHSGKRHR